MGTEGERSSSERAGREEKKRKIKDDVHKALHEERFDGVDGTNMGARDEIDKVKDEVDEAIKEDKNEEKGIYQILVETIKKYDTPGDEVTPHNSHVLNYLYKAREKLLAHARASGMWDELREKIEQIQRLNSETQIMAQIRELEGRAEAYGESFTKLRSAEVDPDAVPLNDLKGVNKDYVRVVRLVTEIAFETAKLEAAGYSAKNDYIDERIEQIGIYGWKINKKNLKKDFPTIFDNARTIMATKGASEQGRTPEYSQTSQLPVGIGAVFNRSIAENLAKQTNAPEGHIVPVLEIVKLAGGEIERDIKPDRAALKKWVTLNMYAFNKESGSSVAGASRTHLEFYLGSDLKRAFKLFEQEYLHKFGNESESRRQIEKLRAAIEETESEMKRQMALHSIVRDMEGSGGAGSKVMAYQLGADNRGNADTDQVDFRQDSLATEDVGLDYYLELLGKDKDDNYKHPEIVKAYNKLLNEMGIGKNTRGEMDELKSKSVRSEIKKVDVNAFRKSDLFKHLFEGKDKNGHDYEGFNSWIKAKLDAEEQRQPGLAKNREERWMAYKTACDMVMADGKFTQWSMKLPGVVQKEIRERGKVVTPEIKSNKLRPSTNWGGDPLANVEDPAILFDKIKGTFKNNPKVAQGVCEAFRDDDLKNRVIPTSYIGCGAKKSVRFNDAIMAAIKDPLGSGMYDLGRDGVASMDTVAGKWLQIYTADEYALDGGGKISKSEYLGRKFSRLLDAKVEAAVSQTPGMDFWDVVAKLGPTTDPRSHVHGEALSGLLGPSGDGRTGFLAEIRGGQKQFKFDSEARSKIDEALNHLYMNDTNEFVLVTANILNFIGFLMAMGLLTAEYVVTTTTGQESKLAAAYKGKR